MVSINGRKIGPGQPCYFIAEIGINHNGSLDTAIELIDRAVNAGAEAVKFQKRHITTVYTEMELISPRVFDQSILDNAIKRHSGTNPVFPVDNLNRISSDGEKTNGDLKYALEFGDKEYDTINIHCARKGITWSASAWDGLSANFINGYDDVHWLKVASACLTHADLLRRVASKKKPVILSTGGSTIEQIQRAVEIVASNELILLHCVAEYPPPDENINLTVMKSLRNAFPSVPIGYSNHSMDTLSAVTAVAMGACVVEAHITLDQNLPGSDHKASLTCEQFEDMVNLCRRVEKMRGDGIKRVLPKEIEVMKKLRRRDDIFSQNS